MDQFVQMLLFGVLKSGIYALTSVGLALSLGVVGIVNFAHGEFVMLGAYVGYWLFVSQLHVDRPVDQNRAVPGDRDAATALRHCGSPRSR